MTDEKLYFGMTGTQTLVVGVIIIGIVSMMGYGPLSGDDGTAGSVWPVSPGGSGVAAASTVDVDLNSAFVSVIVNDTITVADVDTNFNDVTGVVSLQFDTKVDSSNGVNTTFTLSTKNTSGGTVELVSYLETGTLTVPVTDQTVPVIVNIDLSVLGGFTSSDQVAYSSVSASGNHLTDSSGIAFYPIVTKATDATEPAIKIDTVLDTKSFSWLAATTTQSIDVTFDVSLTGVSKMDDISDKISVPIIIEGGDDSPITIEIIRNDAIIA